MTHAQGSGMDVSSQLVFEERFINIHISTLMKASSRLKDDLQRFPLYGYFFFLVPFLLAN